MLVIVTFSVTDIRICSKTYNINSHKIINLGVLDRIMYNIF